MVFMSISRRIYVCSYKYSIKKCFPCKYNFPLKNILHQWHVDHVKLEYIKEYVYIHKYQKS